MPDFSCRTALILFCLAAAPAMGDSHAPPSAAQADTAQPAVPRVEQIGAELRRLTNDLNSLRAATPPEGGAAELVLGVELAARRQQFRRRVAELDVELERMSEAGEPDNEVERWLSELLQSDAPILAEEVRAQDAEVVRLVDSLMSAEQADRQDAHNRLRIVVPEADRLYEDWDANIRMREDLGLDIADERRLLVERLERRAQSQAGVLRTIGLIVGGADPAAAEEPASAGVMQRLARLEDIFAASTRTTIKLLDTLDRSTTDLREALITLTGTVPEGVLNIEVLQRLWKEWTDDVLDWTRDEGPAILVKLLVVLLILLAARGVAGFVERLTRSALNRSPVQTSNLLKDFFVKSARRAVVLLGLLIAIAQFGIQIGPLLAGLGIAGFVIGFALQDVLSNFASGMMILVYRPFDVGDFVEAGGVTGKVDDMTLVSTKILTVDNQLLFVPNNKIWGDVIRNVTHQDIRRIDLVFGIGYSDDIEKAERVLASVITDHALVLDDPEPVVKLHELGDSSVNFVVRPWVKTEDYWDVYWDLTREVKRRFDAEGLSIPFPQRDVHLYQASLPATSDSAPDAEKGEAPGHTGPSQAT